MFRFARKSSWLAVGALGIGAAVIGVNAQSNETKYPAPRFLQGMANPSPDQLLQAARLVVRQPYGMAALGKAERGWTVHVLLPYNQDMATFRAVQQAWAERGVKAIPVQPWEVAGLTKADFDVLLEKHKALLKGDEAYKEIAVFDPLYYPYLPAAVTKDVGSPVNGPNGRYLDVALYLDKHPEVKRIFFAPAGGASFFCNTLPRHCGRHFGNWKYMNPVDVMNHGLEYPADVWGLVEETIVKPAQQVSEGRYSDPQGTDIHWVMSRENARQWSTYAKVPAANNHMFLYPNPIDTTSFEGVVAGTANHTGFMPAMKVHLSGHGKVTKVEGGGRTGELFRMLVESPKLNFQPDGKPVCFPKMPECGYWFIGADGMGTNPKLVRNMPTLIEGTTELPNVWERERGGVQHLSFAPPTGHHVAARPEVLKAIKEKRGVTFFNSDPILYDYAYKNKLPVGHTAHIHNYFSNMKWRLRDTGEWITIADKGRLAAYDNPEVRALASKYGDPDTIFSYDWVPAIPGINVAGDYAVYAQDPWRWTLNEWKVIMNGTYRYFIPNYQMLQKVRPKRPA